MTTAVASALLRRRGAILGRGVRFEGLPIVAGCEIGELSIGDRAVLASKTRATELGVRTPMILRLMAPGARIRIGADSGLSGTVICAAVSVEIGARALIGADVMIFDTDFHNPEAVGRRYAASDWKRISAPVTIGDDVFIGTRAIIQKGVSIGEGSIIGAGSVVVGNVPPYTIAAGNPARTIWKVPRTMAGE
jgi:acetyltransferase-like isoleucine patch superfamily enzyme